MPRRHALLLGAIAALTLAAAPLPKPYAVSYVGPSAILFADADTVFLLRSQAWHSASARHQEKLLQHGLRMRYWRDHLPSEMREVFETLGYPSGRLLLTPVGHAEEWWYYGPLAAPLRFRDGILLDRDAFRAHL